APCLTGTPGRPKSIPGWFATVARTACAAIGYRGDEGFSTATPHGRMPTGIFFTTCCVVTSTTETSFDGPFAVKTVLPSGARPTPHGRMPTASDPAGMFFDGSTRKSCPNDPVVTYSI